MRTATTTLLLLAAFSAPLAAQGLPDDTVAPRLRQRIEENFRAAARDELGLTDDQADKVFAVGVRYASRRRDLEAAHRGLNELLAGELRPGVAANNGTITRALDSIAALQVTQARLFGDEQRDLAAILTPVQRGQLYRMRSRLADRITTLREERMQRRPGMLRRP